MSHSGNLPRKAPDHKRVAEAGGSQEVNMTGVLACGTRPAEFALGLRNLARIYDWLMGHELYRDRPSTVSDWVRNLEWIRAASRVAGYEIDRTVRNEAENSEGTFFEAFQEDSRYCARIVDLLNNAAFALSGSGRPDLLIPRARKWLDAAFKVSNSWIESLSFRDGFEDSSLWSAHIANSRIPSSLRETEPLRGTRNIQRMNMAEHDGTRQRVAEWRAGERLTNHEQCVLCMDLRLFFLTGIVKDVLRIWVGSKSGSRKLRNVSEVISEHSFALEDGRVTDLGLCASIERRKVFLIELQRLAEGHDEAFVFYDLDLIGCCFKTADTIDSRPRIADLADVA